MSAPRRIHSPRRRAAAIALSMAALVAGCSDKPPPRGEVERPVKTMVVVDGGDTRTRVFPGRVEASRSVELSFQVSGLIVSLPIKEGQRLKKGDVVAQLRQDEFQARLKTLQAQLDQAQAVLAAQQAGERPEEILRLESNVRAAEARLSRARTEYERLRRLFERQFASNVEYNDAEMDYAVARENYKAAQQMLEAGTIARQEDIEAQRATVRALEARVVEANIQLADSTLRAPYDGVVAEVFGSENRSIRAKEPVLRFQDVDEVEVALDIPESIMTTDIRTADIVEMIAEFSGARGLRFPVEIREVAQAADPITQTFTMRVGMQAPKEVRLLPGMTATVTVTYRRADILNKGVLVPIASVFKRSTGDQVAWVVGPDQTVQSRPVKLGAVMGGKVEVLDGVQAGDRIAIAGVSFLRDGMRVRVMGETLGAAP